MCTLKVMHVHVHVHVHATTYDLLFPSTSSFNIVCVFSLVTIPNMLSFLLRSHQNQCRIDIRQGYLSNTINTALLAAARDGYTASRGRSTSISSRLLEDSLSMPIEFWRVDEISTNGETKLF